MSKEKMVESIIQLDVTYRELVLLVEGALEIRNNRELKMTRGATPKRGIRQKEIDDLILKLVIIQNKNSL